MLPFLLYGLIGIVTIIVGLIVYARWNFGTLEKLGVPVVKLKSDHFLLGQALASFETPGGELDIQNMKKYGPVFGLYEGREPQIFICDAELFRSITTKDADHFDAKRSLDFGEPVMNEMPDFQQNVEKWKILRNMSSPVFSSTAKLKNAHPAMREVISEYIADVKRQAKASGSGKVEQYALDNSIFAMLTELIARSQFSISIDKSADMNNRFVKNVKQLLTPPAVDAPAWAVWSYAFPFIKSFLPNTLVDPEPVKEFVAIIKQLMEMRRKERAASTDKFGKDFLDSLIEWYDNLGSPEMKKNNITENNIWNLAIVLFIAGQDQISLILAVMMYFVSKNPEIEKKLHAEVDKVFAQKKGVIDHDALADLPYLTACVSEAIRLYPFFYRAERVCTKDWSCPERGFRITKGTVVQLSIWGLHRNPEYFEDPEEFKPERFLPGNKEKLHPYANASFGFGPRNCSGKRLAMEIMLLLAAYLAKELKFLKRSDTQLKFLPAGPFFGAHEPIYFDVMPRNGNEE